MRGVEMEHILTGDVGGRLKHARELRGLSLSDVARRTKLPSKVLHAIERNDFASLPGGMFRKAYIRTVAAEVGLDPREVVAEYCDRFEPPIAAVAVPTRDAALQDKWLEQLTPSPQRSMVGLAAVAVPALAWFMLQSVAAGTRAPVDSAASETAAAPMSQPASIALTADSSGGTATPSVTPAP